MSSAAATLFFVGIQLFLGAQCQESEPEIVLRPLTYVTYENHYDVTFECTISNVTPSAVHVTWFVNDTFSDEVLGPSATTQETLNELTIQGRLSVPARMEYNNSRIVCSGTIAASNLVLTSDSAIFMVQGILTECQNVTVQPMGPYHQVVQRDPPFTLDITDITNDLYGYRVCTNVSTDCKYYTYSIWLVDGIEDADVRQFIILNLQTPVEVNVSARNVVGYGTVSRIVVQPYSMDASQSLSEADFTTFVRLNRYSEPQATVEFEATGSCFDTYQIELEGRDELHEVMEGSVGSGIPQFTQIPEVDQNGTVTLHISQLRENKHYSAKISTLQDYTEIWMFSFQTYDVQEVRITAVTDTSVLIECTFAEESQANGCAVTFNPPTDIPDMFIRIWRPLLSDGYSLPDIVTSTISAPEPPYTVLVYDIERYGSISDSPAIELLVEMPDAQPSPSLSTVTILVVAVLLVLVLVVVVVVVVVILWKKKKQKLSWHLSSRDLYTVLEEPTPEDGMDTMTMQTTSEKNEPDFKPRCDTIDNLNSQKTHTLPSAPTHIGSSLTCKTSVTMPTATSFTGNERQCRKSASAIAVDGCTGGKVMWQASQATTCTYISEEDSDQ